MERSRVTVEYSHLPGQVFEHEANGVYCVTRSIGGRTTRRCHAQPGAGGA